MPQDALLPETLAALAERVRNGDPNAEDELVRLYDKQVFVMTYARTRDREVARDLTQDAMMALVKALRGGHVREPERLGAYVHGIAKHLVFNYFHKLDSERHNVPLDEVDDIPVPPKPDPNDFMYADVARRMLERADPIDRKILLMSFVDGYSAAEIASQLDLSCEVVRQRKFRVLNKIRERVKKMSQK